MVGLVISPTCNENGNATEIKKKPQIGIYTGLAELASAVVL